MARICVLGAGVVGLSSAVNIQSILPEADITLIADQFNQETTSDGAAGHFDANIAGIHRTHGYKLWRTETPPPFHSSFDYGCRALSKSELLRLPGNYTFTNKGGKVIRKKLISVDEIAGSYDVIVNCTGLGSRKLFDDKELVPIRGHLIRVKAPWIKTLFIDEDDTYIFSGQDTVVLGGTYERGEYRLDKDQRYYDDIMAQCCRLVPSLKHAEVERTWVGLRPWRPSVRLEVEMISLGGRRLPVVHNYGHGADGVCLSWGCGVEAANLVKQQLTKTGAPRLVSKL
uniref:D-aspartate oxidase n=1 Tax=Magallana gigas TaxID=29159 RepID=K1P6Q6_MAGGI